MGKFDGILLCTDLDGTLLRKDKSVSNENKEAIEHFKREGGYFTIVTGRMIYYIEDILEKVKPNIAFGCANGGGLYDPVGRKYLWTSTMPEGILELVKCIDDKFPNVGIQVCTFERTCFCKNNAVTEHFRKVTGLPNITCHYEDVKEPIAKILFCTDCEEEIMNIQDTLYSHPLSDRFDFIRSERTLYEILPKGINKGTSITKLCELLNIDINKTIAIGDYNNDIPMFSAAKIGIAVSNACPEALAVADFVTVSNEQHAIAKVICDIENGEYLQ